MKTFFHKINSHLFVIVTRIVTVILWFGAISGFLVGIWTLAIGPCGLFKQCIEYLQYGYWKPYPLTKWLDWTNPQSWYGLHSVLESLGIVFFSFVAIPCFYFAGLCLGYALTLQDDLDDRYTPDYEKRGANSTPKTKNPTD